MVETDVVVIGAGAAGLAAANSARQAGLEALLLDKETRPGGTTARAVGSICVCVRSAGDTDAEFMADIAGFVAPELRSSMPPDLYSLVAEESELTVDWLADLGVRFAGPYQEPPHRRPRLYAAVPDGRGVVAALADSCRRAGVDVTANARAVRLVKDGGRVVGVVVEVDGRQITVRARRGVVVATGDFAGNGEWRTRFLSRAAAVSPAVNTASLGEGIRLGAQAGGAVRALAVAFAPQLRFRAADTADAADTVAVDKQADSSDLTAVAHAAMGRARMAPARHLFEHGACLMRADGQLIDYGDADALTTPDPTSTYVILDSRWLPGGELHDVSVSSAPAIGFATLADYVAARPDLVTVADSAAQLGKLLGIDVSGLADMLGGASPRLRPPLVALGPAGPVVTVTEGSLAVDREQRVLDDRGQVIAGLYAVGAAGQGGLLLWGHGLHLAWAVISGRLVGASVAGHARADDA